MRNDPVKEVIIRKKLFDMIVESGFPIDRFIKLALMEKFNHNELDNLQYMYTKLQIYLEDFDLEARKEKRIIFLDVDGVLNMYSSSYYSAAWVNLGSDTVERHLMVRLEYLIEQTNALIVVSSSWHIRQLITVLKKLRFKYIDRLIEHTPKWDTDKDEHIKWRGDQIQAWIDGTDWDYTKDRYVVLEDEIIDVCGNKCMTIPREYVVETNMDEGISHKDIVLATSILNK